ncbi:unnamed protein product [Dovyalis caffra]|uniref:Uncharacterized protein n=1 Tax=Dovyalis caffra TaxID=77055 RepID=A0AAV1S148_9ROSI|nr:unnamed protein product [Dovyalis caffra]
MDHHEFAQTLGDEAKLWLPSDMFLSEVIPSEYSPNSHNFSCNMDDLAHHLATLSFLEDRPARNLCRPPAPKPTPCSQCIIPVVRDVSVNHLLPGYHNLDFNGGVEVGQRLNGNGPGHLSTRFDPVYNFQVKQQVDEYLETRARVLQNQQNRLQNRVYPFQGNGRGLGGGFTKESGGTGVFHPRIVNPTTTTSTNVLKKKEAVAQCILQNSLSGCRLKSVAVEKDISD